MKSQVRAGREAHKSIIQCFDEEKRPLTEITEEDLFENQRHFTREESSAYEKGLFHLFIKTGKIVF